MKTILFHVLIIFVVADFLHAQSHFSGVVETGLNPYSIVIQEAKINGDNLSSGDEIGVFDISATGDTILVGATIFEGVYPFHLTAWAEDEQNSLRGYKADNTMHFIIWDTSESELLNTHVTVVRGDGTFGAGAFAVVKIESKQSVILNTPHTEILNTDSASIVLDLPDSNVMKLKFIQGEIAGDSIELAYYGRSAPVEIPTGNRFDANAILGYYEIISDITNFSAEIVFEYTDASLGTMNENNLTLAYYNNVRNVWMSEDVNVVIVPDSNRIYANIVHFSTWAICDKTN